MLAHCGVDKAMKITHGTHSAVIAVGAYLYFIYAWGGHDIGHTIFNEINRVDVTFLV